MTDVTIPADVAKEMAALFRAGTRGVMAAKYREWTDLLDPKPPTLREKVARAWCADYYGETSGSAADPSDDQLSAADAVLAVIADELAKRPLADWPMSRDYCREQRAADVAWLRGQS